MEQETIAQTMLDQLVTDENSQMLKDLLPVCVYTYFHFFHNDYKHDTRIQPALEKH